MLTVKMLTVKEWKLPNWKMLTVKEWKLSKIVTISSILDVTVALDPI